MTRHSWVMALHHNQLCMGSSTVMCVFPTVAQCFSALMGSLFKQGNHVCRLEEMSSWCEDSDLLTVWPVIKKIEKP